MLYLANVYGPPIWCLDSCILQEHVGASSKIFIFLGVFLVGLSRRRYEIITNLNYNLKRRQSTSTRKTSIITTLNRRLAVETIFLFLKIINYVIFALTILLKMRHTFVLECPLCNLTRDNFLLLFEKVVLGSLKCFFQLNQQLEISLYLKEAIALCHS